jgi:hypothetical protein
VYEGCLGWATTTGVLTARAGICENQQMTTIDLGPNVRLEKVSDFPRAAKDPNTKPPADIAARFPANAENVRCDPSGTWYATVEELVTVLEGKKKVQRPRHRIHWLDGTGTVRVAKDLEVFHELAFKDNVALLTGDRGKLLQLSLEDGTIGTLAVTGHTFDDEARLYEIFILEGDRVVVHEREQELVLIGKYRAKGLEQVNTFAFKGAFTVVGGRFLVGGGKTVCAFDLAADPVEVGASSEIGVANFWGCGDKVRLYSGKTGAWDIKIHAR